MALKMQHPVLLVFILVQGFNTLIDICFGNHLDRVLLALFIVWAEQTDEFLWLVP